MKEYLEITTYIGCPINCLEFCPQELIKKKYDGVSRMTFDAFFHLTRKIPHEVIFDFSGLSECFRCDSGTFSNPSSTAMILHAHGMGHPIRLSTTLSGLCLNDAKRLCKIPFEEVVLHLPDAKQRAKIPVTEEYKDVVFYFLEHCDSISRIMNMSGKMKSCNVEKLARGQIKETKKGRVICPHLEVPGYQLMPNGDVIFCCNMRGLTGKIGNLYHNTYKELAAKFPDISSDLQTDPNSICHKCPEAENYHIRNLKATKDNLIGRILS